MTVTNEKDHKELSELRDNFLEEITLWLLHDGKWELRQHRLPCVHVSDDNERNARHKKYDGIWQQKPNSVVAPISRGVHTKTKLHS